MGANSRLGAYSNKYGSSVILGENILLVHSCCVNSSISVVNKNGCTSDNVKFNTSLSRF